MPLIPPVRRKGVQAVKEAERTAVSRLSVSSTSKRPATTWNTRRSAFRQQCCLATGRPAETDVAPAVTVPTEVDVVLMAVVKAVVTNLVFCLGFVPRWGWTAGHALAA